MTQSAHNKEKVAEFVEGQQGRITLAQLQRLGVSTSTAQTWEAASAPGIKVYARRRDRRNDLPLRGQGLKSWATTGSSCTSGRTR